MWFIPKNADKQQVHDSNFTADGAPASNQSGWFGWWASESKAIKTWWTIEPRSVILPNRGVNELFLYNRRKEKQRPSVNSLDKNNDQVCWITSLRLQQRLETCTCVLFLNAIFTSLFPPSISSICNLHQDAFWLQFRVDVILLYFRGEEVIWPNRCPQKHFGRVLLLH